MAYLQYITYFTSFIINKSNPYHLPQLGRHNKFLQSEQYPTEIEATKFGNIGTPGEEGHPTLKWRSSGMKKVGCCMSTAALFVGDIWCDQKSQNVKKRHPKMSWVWAGEVLLFLQEPHHFYYNIILVKQGVYHSYQTQGKYLLRFCWIRSVTSFWHTVEWSKVGSHSNGQRSIESSLRTLSSKVGKSFKSLFGLLSLTWRLHLIQ